MAQTTTSQQNPSAGERATARSGPGRDLYDLLTGDEDARVCKDIPEAACREQPRNFFLHIGALVLTKTGDGIADAKLVLPWLLSSLGAPAFLFALLVPIRESLSLLPQLFAAAAIRKAPVRKWFWTAGSIAQAAALLAMALSAMTLTGAAGAWAVVGSLAVFSLARGICSVASKDVMGKTVSKSRRGRLSGYATNIAGLAVGALGLYLIVFDRSDDVGFLALLLCGAAGLWLLAAGLYAGLAESPGETSGGGNAFEEAKRQIRLLHTDPPFRAFVLARALLLSTALAAPFYVALARENGGETLTGLGWLVVASGLAASMSALVWGPLADRSSRTVMAVAGLMAGLLGAGVLAVRMIDPQLADGQFFYAGVIFVLATAHAGVRLGRKTYVVDMADTDTRAAYVAVSNTVIGVLLLAASGLGMVADRAGIEAVIGVLTVLSFAGAVFSARLKEVE